MQKQEQNFLQPQQMEWWVIIYLHISYSIIVRNQQRKMQGRINLQN